MSNYKVGDKFIIEIVEAIKGYGNNPNMPDPLNMPVLYRIKGFNALVFDENGLNKLQKLNPQKTIEDIDDMLAEQEIRQEAFNAGMEEAWKMAKLIGAFEKDGGIEESEIEDIFGFSSSDVFSNCTMQEVKKTLEKRQKTIRVGDVVTNGHVTMLVTGIGGESGLLFLIGKDGEIKTRQKPEHYTKTGQTLDIQTILAQIGGAE